MSSRMRRPETVKLDISRGDWLLVKKYLTAGEQRHIYRNITGSVGDNGDWYRFEYLPALVAGYLLDWSITDADNKPVVIFDQPPNVVMAALDNLDSDSFKEIRQAIEKHIEAVEKELALEKNGQAIASGSSATSRSRKRSAGGTNGSLNSPSMSTTS